MKLAWLINTLLGVVLIGGGSAGVVNEMRHNTAIALAAIAAGLQPPAAHYGPMYGFLIVAVLGGLLINPTPNNPAPLFAVIKGIVVVVAPIVPWSKVAKERRSSAGMPAVKDAAEPSPQDDERG